MIRQDFQSVEYFLQYFDSYKKQIERRKNMLESGQVKTERIIWFMKSSFDIELDFLIANYTFGNSKSELRNFIFTPIKILDQSWAQEIVLLIYNNKSLNQYTLSSYDQMLWMLSLGYLLEIPESDFKKLVELIDRDGVKDYLFEFIISAKLGDREPIPEESYRENFGVPKVFEKLRQAIVEIDKSKAEKLVKEFITKDWYRNHKGQGWYDCHKSKHDTYFGYWSFETAAIVKILGIDDSSFIDCKYYPKDLVH